MSVKDVHKYLKDTVSLGTLTVDDRVLGHVGVDPFLAATLPGGLIAIRDAEVQPPGDTSVAVVGTGQLLGAPVTDLTAEFTETASGFEFTCRAGLPTGWKPSASFPNLPGSLNYSLGMPFPQGTYLDELTLTDAALVITSAPLSAPDGVQLSRGVNLTAVLGLDGHLSDIGAFSNATTAQLGGALDLTGSPPTLNLQAPVPFHVTFGGVSVDDVHVVLYSSLDSEQDLDSFFAVTSKLHANGFHLDIATRLTLGSADLVVQQGTFEPEQVQVPSLGDLAALVGGTDLEQLLPEPLRGDTGLYFSRLDFAIRPSTTSAVYVELVLESSADTVWRVVPDVLEVSGLQTTWHVGDPLNTNDARSLALAIAGTMHVAGTPFEVQARVPEGFVLCSLAPGSDIDLGRLLGHVGLDVDVVGISDLRCTELRLSADVTGAAYGFYTELEGDWRLPVGGGDSKLALTGLSFEFDTSRHATQVDVRAELAVGDAQLFVSGRSEPTGGGWTFEGGTSGASEIRLDHLVDELLQLFGTSLPAGVPEITLRNLDVAFNTQTKEFDFTGETDTEIEVPFITGDAAKIHAQVKLASTVDPSSGSRVLSGFMEGDLEIGSSLFVLQYTMGQESHVFRASWESTNPADLLGLQTLLDAMGIGHDVEIPAGLDLNLKKVYLEYQAERETLTLVADSATFGEAFLIASKLPLGAPAAGQEAGTGQWEFVFGLEYAGHAKLSDIPVIGAELGAADIFTFEELGILIASADLQGFTIPQLPALEPITPGADAGTATPEPARTPIAAGTELKLQKGISVVGVIGLETSEQTGQLQALRTFVTQSRLTITASWSPGGQIRLAAVLDGSIDIPTGGSSALTIGNAGIAFIFADGITFQVYGELAMHFDHETIDVRPLLSVSPEAAIFAVDVEFEDGWRGPMGLAGLTLDEVGFEMGVNFIPPGLDLGLQGKSHIGDQPKDSDDFAFVLEIIEEIPNPLLLSFYLQVVNVATALELFAPDADTSSLPGFVTDIAVTQVSFYWADSVVTLPDGTVAQPGLAFSGNVDIFGFEAHAALRIDQVVGIQGDLESSPVHVAHLLDVTGHGKGVYINMKDQKPVRQTALPPSDTSGVERVEVVPAGGPVIQFRTSQSPYLFVSLLVTFLDLAEEEVEALVTSDGILFKIAYAISDIATAELDFTLGKDGFHLHSQFGLHLKADLGPIVILGVDFGTIHLDAGFDVELEVVADAEELGFAISADFEFEGARLTMPTLRLEVAPASLTRLPELMIEHIADNVEEIFSDLFDAALQFFEDAGKAIAGAAEAAGEEIAKLGHEAVEEAEQIVADAEQAVASAAQAVAAEVTAIEHEAEQIAEAAVHEVEQIAQAAVQEVEAIGQEIASVVSAAAHEIEAIGEEIAQEAQVVAREVARLASEALAEVEAIGRAVAREVGKILDDARRAAEAVIAAAQQVVDALVREAEHLWNEAKALAEAAARALESAAHAVANTAKKAWNTIKKY